MKTRNAPHITHHPHTTRMPGCLMRPPPHAVTHATSLYMRCYEFSLELCPLACLAERVALPVGRVLVEGGV